MTDTLLGVVIGGLIGWIAPLMTLRYGERRWKFEARLNELKSVRERFERLYESNLKLLGEGMTQNSYSSNMTSDILVLMPKEISDLFSEHMAETENTELKTKHMYLGIAAAMKRDLKARDAEILALFAK
jgi:gas vesicle protein